MGNGEWGIGEAEPGNVKSGDGSAVSLQDYLGVGKRHCRLLYIISAQPELIQLEH